MAKLWIVGRNDAFYAKVFSDRVSAELFRDEMNESVYNANNYRVMDGEIASDSGIQVVNTDKRVRMTQTEYDEWQELYRLRHSQRAYYALQDLELGNFKSLYEKFAVNIEEFQTFANLWVSYDPEEPDVTIKIEDVVEKWFVRTSHREGNYYYWMKKMQYSDAFPKFEYDTKPSEDVIEFDTKEEAEKWLNPQLEVVKLEVVK